MKRDIKRLEELVTRAAERLEGLVAERDELDREVRSLRVRISELEESAASRDLGDDGGEPLWQAQRGEILGALRETLADLQSETAAPEGGV